MGDPGPDGITADTLARARGGDRAAIEAVLLALADTVYRAAASRLGDGPDAEDAAQEALMRIARGLATFRGEASPRTWAWRIALRAAADRRSALDRRLRAAPRGPAPASAPEDTISDEEERARVRQALDRLPDEQRDVVVLRLWEGLPFPAIAEAIRCPLPTVHSRMARALDRLRGALGNAR